jgi:hypothetical protein
VWTVEEIGAHMKLWLKWTVMATVALVASGYAFVSFWAAVELGYDAHVGGKSIITGWGYAALGCLLAGILCGIMAVRTRPR